MPYHHMAVNLSDSVWLIKPLEDGLQALYTNWKENPGDSVI